MEIPLTPLEFARRSAKLRSTSMRRGRAVRVPEKQSCGECERDASGACPRPKINAVRGPEPVAGIALPLSRLPKASAAGISNSI